MYDDLEMPFDFIFVASKCMRHALILPFSEKQWGCTRPRFIEIGSINQ